MWYHCARQKRGGKSVSAICLLCETSTDRRDFCGQQRLLHRHQSQVPQQTQFPRHMRRSSVRREEIFSLSRCDLPTKYFRVSKFRGKT